MPEGTSLTIHITDQNDRICAHLRFDAAHDIKLNEKLVNLVKVILLNNKRFSIKLKSQ